MSAVSSRRMRKSDGVVQGRQWLVVVNLIYYLSCVYKQCDESINLLRGFPEWLRKRVVSVVHKELKKML